MRAGGGAWLVWLRAGLRGGEAWSVRRGEERVWHLVRDFLHSVNQAHFVEGVDERRQTTVNAKNSSVDNRGDVHTVKHVAASLPN